MEYALILAKKIAIMLIYVFVGFLLFKKKIIKQNESKALATMLVYVVSPCIILKSFLLEFSTERLKGFVLTFVISFIIIMIWTMLNRIIYKEDIIARFSSNFTNSGFMGIPLVESVLGTSMRFYCAPFQMHTASLQFIYSSILFAKEKNIVRLLIKTPAVIAMIAGFFMFITNIGGLIPDIIVQAINGLASFSNLSMILIGIYFAQIDFKMLYISKVLKVCMIKMFILPLISIVFLKALPIDKDIQLAIAIVCCCPFGSNSPVYAEKYGKDYTYACALVTLCTILSVITIPLMIMIASL